MSELETPSAIYLAGRREWSERYGSYISRAKHWRWMAMVLAGTTAVSTFSAVWMASQAHVVPYVINVDKLGEALAVGVIPPAPPASSGLIKSQLARWVFDTHTIYADPIAEQNIMTEAANWIDQKSDALQQFGVEMQANDPRVLQAKEAVGTTIETIGQIGADTWQVDYRLETRMKDATGTLYTYWREDIRIKISPPSDEDTIRVNPAGIYVEWYTTTPRPQ